MSSPSASATPGTPTSDSRRGSRRSSRSSSLMPAGLEPSSDLAQPLPASPTPTLGPPDTPTPASQEAPPRSLPPGGPGSVLVSEIDLSSPLNYGTPSSVGSSQFRTSVGGARGTPIRIRSDIQSERRLRQVTVTPAKGAGPAGSESDIPPPTSDVGVTPTRRSGRSRTGTPARAPPRGPPSEIVPASEASDSAPHLVIWGTDVSVQVCKQKFKKFLASFLDEALEDDERMEGFEADEPLYMQRLAEINVTEDPYMNINCGHIQQFDEDLYRQLVCYPQEVIPTFDMAVNEMFFEKYPDMVLAHQIQVRPFNADKTRNMRALNPEDIDQLITITGMVIRTSSLMPEMAEALFRCSVCHLTATVEVERGRIAEPTLCTNCNTNHSFTMIHNRSKFSDKQMIKLQESPDDMPAGQTPHTVVLYAHGDLVDKVQPGDRISVTGIYRAVPVKVNPLVRNIKSIYKTHIDVVHFRRTDARRLHNGGDESKEHVFAEERVALLKELSRKPDIYERLARAIAPSIYENEDIKKGILLQLFGGSQKDFSHTGRGGNFRSEINILLCGDPGTSKSQLLQYVYNLVPRSQYTSGKGSSAVGLTAYVTKDPETRQLVLQTGALVLADNGICCIDEFDKMNDSTRSILHEVMEQQTLSIAKAGIICQLNARTSVLAAANPIESQWNNKKTIVENIQLPHTLMSRFDLIFLILDPQDELFDKRLGRHLVSLYYRSGDESEEEHMDMSILRDYLAYSKQHFNPKLTEEAGTHLIQSYVKMRQVGSGRGQVTAYPRQLESLIRLAEAHAKMRMSETVEVIDVEEANRIHREALKQSATDPMSGTIDLSIITTGQSEGYRKRRMEVKNTLKAIIDKKGKQPTLNFAKTWSELRDGSDMMITRDMYEDALKDLSDDGIVTLTGRATIRINPR